MCVRVERQRAPVIYGGGQIATSWRAPARGKYVAKGKIKTVAWLGGLIRNKGKSLKSLDIVIVLVRHVRNYQSARRILHGLGDASCTGTRAQSNRI